jgi:hypothetical protein
VGGRGWWGRVRGERHDGGMPNIKYTIENVVQNFPKKQVDVIAVSAYR